MAKTAIPEPSGKPSASRFSASTGTVRVNDADIAIAPLLQRATTLKLRGQWEEAITVATDAVRRTPGSAAAHALLGDIYAAQNNTDDALHWYHMALARNPQDTVTAQKHEVLLAQKRASVTGSMPAVTLSHGHGDTTNKSTADKHPLLTAKVPTGSGTAERTLEWLDKIFPPGRSEGITRLLFTISGIVALVVIITGAVLYFGGSKNDTDSDPSLAVGGINSVATPVSLPSPPNSSSTIKTPNPSLSPASDATPMTAPSTAVSSELTKELAALQSGAVTITSAETDKTKTQVQLELQVITNPEEPTATTRTRVLTAAASATRAAATALPSLERFSVRVLMKSGMNGASSSLVFVGTTSRTALQVLVNNEKPPQPTLLPSLFTNTWWENNLNPTVNP